MEIVQPPTSLVFSLESGSAGSSSHPCGRPSTSQAATFNSLGGTVTWGAGNRHRFLIPPSLLFPSGPTQLPVTEKSSVATRSRPACSVAFPTPRLESSGGWTRRTSCPRALYCLSFSSHLSTIHPSRSPETRRLQIFKGLRSPSRRYRDEEIASGFTPLAASRLAVGEFPGRRPRFCRPAASRWGFSPAVWGWWRVAQ